MSELIIPIIYLHQLLDPTSDVPRLLFVFFLLTHFSTGPMYQNGPIAPKSTAQIHFANCLLLGNLQPFKSNTFKDRILSFPQNLYSWGWVGDIIDIPGCPNQEPLQTFFSPISFIFWHLISFLIYLDSLYLTSNLELRSSNF